MRIFRRIFHICVFILFILGIIVAALHLFTAQITALLPASVVSFLTTVNNFIAAYITFVYLGLIVIALYYFFRLIFKVYNKEMLDIYDPKTRVPKEEHEPIERVLYTKIEKAEFGLDPKPLVIDHDTPPPPLQKAEPSPIVAQPDVLATEPKPLDEVVKTKVMEPTAPVVEQAKLEIKPEPPLPVIVEEKLEVVPQQVEQPPQPASVIEPMVTPVVEVEVKEKQAPKKKSTPPKSLIGLNKVKTVDYELYSGLTIKVGANWIPVFEQEKAKPYFKDLMDFIQEEYANKKVYPAPQDIFKCFELTDLSNVRVIILGKIPYYRKDQADGLAFSTKMGSDLNPTTKIIIEEAVSDVGIPTVEHGSLQNWAKQGVLLMNTTFTAPSDKPASHGECGWLEFSHAIIEHIRSQNCPIVTLLWGEHGASYEDLLTCENTLVLKAPNPSPLSAANGFYGSKPFSKANEFLIAKGYQAIDWRL